jgi:threonine/homoserine/homoserine lactone efflux protein
VISSLGIGFVMGWVGSMPLAGAVSIFVFQRGLSGRLRDGLVLAAGAALAESLWCLAALLGAEKVLGRWPMAEAVARSCGGLILIALGIYFFVRKGGLGEPTAADNAPRVSLRRQFWLGFSLVAGNVSIPFTWLGLILVAVSLGLDPLAGAPTVFAAGVALGILGWFALLLRVLGRLRERFRPQILVRVMMAMGGLLLAVGAATLIRAWV